jgi:hypothetical protein
MAVFFNTIVPFRVAYISGIFLTSRTTINFKKVLRYEIFDKRNFLVRTTEISIFPPVHC